MSVVSHAEQQRAKPGRNLAAAVVVFAMLVAALSLWTAIPLTWVYIASQLSATQFPSGGPYLVVIFGVLGSIVLVGWLLGRLNSLYVRITGSNTLRAIRPNWLRSMRDTTDTRNPTTILEAVMIGSVGLAALTATLWFFFLAGSPLPAQ